MPNNSITQPSLFGNSDTRPLPLIIADKWGFPLQHHIVNDEYLYAVQDWFRGLMQKEDVRKNISKANQMSTESRQVKLPYIANDNKTYQMDFCTAETLYVYAQRMDAKTGIRKAVTDYLAKAGVKLDEYRLDPSQAIEDSLSTYETQGKSKLWIESRALGVITRKQFMDALKNAVLHADGKTYAQATESVYKGLWESTTAQLRGTLDLEPKQNPRDHFGEYALIYTRLAEMLATERLGKADVVPVDVAMSIVYEASALIRKQAQATANALGIDLITGTPLLS